MACRSRSCTKVTVELWSHPTLPLDGGGSETWRRRRLVAAEGVRPRPEAAVQGRNITPIQLRLAAARQCFIRSEEHTSELQSLMRISYAVFCLKKTIQKKTIVH